jgi:hypothetical protein
MNKKKTHSNGIISSAPIKKYCTCTYMHYIIQINNNFKSKTVLYMFKIVLKTQINAMVINEK